MSLTIENIQDAWVRLYDDEAFADNVLTVKGQTDLANLKEVTWDNGTNGPNDRVTSVRFQIPAGWKVMLFDDTNYKDSHYELKGTGKVVEIPKLGSFGDKCSSLRWEQEPA